MPFERVASLSDIADEDIVPVEVGGRALVLCRNGDRLYAMQRKCLHQGADLTEGIVSRGYVVCALHGWRFDLATGVHDMSPMNCLRTHAVRVDGDDVYVDSTPNPMPIEFPDT